MLLDSKFKKEKEVVALGEKLYMEIIALQETAVKFQRQLKELFGEFDKNQSQIGKRCNKAVDYFSENLFAQLITPLHKHIEDLAYKKQVKKYLAEVQEVYAGLWIKMEQLYEISASGEKLYQGKRKHQRSDLKIVKTSATSAKAKKGSTYEDTLALLNDDNTIAEIAEIRSMSPTTIEGHVARWIKKGKVHLEDVMEVQRIEKIYPYFEKNEDWALTSIKEKIPFETSYGELKLIRAYAETVKEGEAAP